MIEIKSLQLLLYKIIQSEPDTFAHFYALRPCDRKASVHKKYYEQISIKLFVSNINIVVNAAVK